MNLGHGNRENGSVLPLSPGRLLPIETTMKRRNSHWTILWIFHIKPANERTFRRIYRPGGDWARLFAKDPNYVGTELLRHATSAGCYVTVDRWASRAAYHNFKKRHRKEFVALDARCESLTVREIKIGEFSSADGAFLFSSKRRAGKLSKRRPLNRENRRRNIGD
jgi:hypothetical protein